MFTHVLGRLEALRNDLAAVDPAVDPDAADRVADLAASLRDVLAGVGLPVVAETADDHGGLAAGH